MVNCKNHGKEAVLLTGAALIHPYVGREIPCGKREKKGRGAPLFWCDGVADEATRGARIKKKTKRSGGNARGRAAGKAEIAVRRGKNFSGSIDKNCGRRV